MAWVAAEKEARLEARNSVKNPIASTLGVMSGVVLLVNGGGTRRKLMKPKTEVERWL